MKLSVTQENLKKALSLASRVATNRAALPVLANILLKTEKNRLIVSATNLEIAITQTVGGKVEKEGSITVPARLLSDFVSSLPSGAVDLELSDSQLKISANQFKSKINGLSSEEFPAIPSISGSNKLSFDAEELKNALQQTIIATSTDETRPVLTAVYFFSQDGATYMVSTDSYRLAERKLDKSNEGLELLVPSSALNDLLRILQDASTGEEVTMHYDDSQVLFRYQDSELITKQIEGNFPKYQQLIPKSSEVILTIDREEFINITKVASLFARESAGSITLEASEKNKRVSIASIASQVGENTSSADATVKGEGSVTLNSRYLLDVLNVIDEPEVEFRFSGKVNPCVLAPSSSKTKSSYLHIIMPLKS